MPLLIGKYVNKIDKKGRVSVPKPFRDAFHGQGFNGLYAYPLFKFTAIEACGEEYMMRLSESLDDMDMFSDDQDNLAAALLESAQPLPFDPEGRVVLPEDLRREAGITDQVLFVGRGPRLRMWQPEAFEAHHGRAIDKLRSGGATFRLRPAGKQGDDE